MQLLAKRADVATGSIYHYFHNKDALIREIFHFITKEESEYLLVDYDDSLDVRARFEHLIRRSILYKVNHPEKFRFRTQYAYLSDIMDELPRSDTFADHPLTHVGRAGQEQGIFKPLSLEQLFYFSLGGMSGVISWKLFENKAIGEKDIQDITQLVWDAIKAE